MSKKKKKERNYESMRLDLSGQGDKEESKYHNMGFGIGWSSLIKSLCIPFIKKKKKSQCIPI